MGLPATSGLNRIVEKHMIESLHVTQSSNRHYCGEFDSHKHEFCQVLFGLKGCLKVDVEGLSAVVDTCLLYTSDAADE